MNRLIYALKTVFMCHFLYFIVLPTAYCDLIEDQSIENTPPVPSVKGGSGGLLNNDDTSSKPTNPKPKQDPQGSVILSPTKQGPEQRGPSESKKTDKSERNRNPDAPIKFWSKGLSGDKSGGIVVLEEDVVVIQDDLRISADKATLKVDKLTNEVLEVVAVGNVLFSRKDPDTGQPVTADSREAVFNNSLRTVVLKGDPRMVRGSDVVRGKQITYDLTTGWVKATRVEGVVQPTKSDSKKPPAPSPSIIAPSTTSPAGQNLEPANDDK